MATQDPDPTATPPPGSRAGRWMESLIAALRVRLELFLLEVEEEKVRLVEVLICLMCLVVFGLVFIGTLSVVLIYFLPDSWRGVGLIGMMLVYGSASLLCLLRLRTLVQREDSMFPETMAQLKKDQACFSDQK